MHYYPPNMKRKRGANMNRAGQNRRRTRPYVPLPVRQVRPVQGAIAKYSANAFRRQQEVKTLDTEFTGAYAAAYVVDTVPCQKLNLNSNTASIQSLNLVQQGAGISQRIGNKISMKSLRLRLQLASAGQNQTLPTYGRVMVLYDRQANGAYIAANNILGISNQNNTIGAGLWIDNLNPNYFDRFVVLMDKLMWLPPATSAGISSVDNQGPTDLCVYQIDEYIKLRNLESQYNGTQNPLLQANVNIGSLLILTYGSIAPGSDAWCLTGSARLRFMDN